MLLFKNSNGKNQKLLKAIIKMQKSVSIDPIRIYYWNKSEQNQIFLLDQNLRNYYMLYNVKASIKYML